MYTKDGSTRKIRFRATLDGSMMRLRCDLKVVVASWKMLAGETMTHCHREHCPSALAFLGLIEQAIELFKLSS
jgi:hypothetical protein